MARKPIDVRCSFCGKRKDQVARLVAGPGVYICDECVALCNEIINQPPAPTTPAGPPVTEWVRSASQLKPWWRRLFRIEAFEPV